MCLPCHRLKSEAEDGGSKNIYPAVDSDTSDQLECWCKQLQEIYTSLVISRYQEYHSFYHLLLLTAKRLSYTPKIIIYICDFV